MRGQWGLITGLVIVLIISVFAVINVDPVEVNYLFGQNEWPLVLVIIGSVLMGGLIVGSVGMYKIYKLQQQIKQLKNRMPESPVNDENDSEEETELEPRSRRGQRKNAK
ncbi:LapA family protein [Salipaludibacillus daqingensis]|uniref:LapA family protein n=1 Tax=Salipaludibacillus daqingensis TaxID=3041001 RepID=UPI002473F433|nr:DUF1049 domain-containing protein [Salipaludibacillus daqingensis]